MTVPPDMPTAREAQQAAVCKRFAAIPLPADPAEKVGIALQTHGRLPLNALRTHPENTTCGWYLWWGEEMGSDAGFFQPLHVHHLDRRCPEILPYLALPPGWRVQLAPDHEDVWFDDALL